MASSKAMAEYQQRREFRRAKEWMAKTEYFFALCRYRDDDIVFFITTKSTLFYNQLIYYGGITPMPPRQTE
jgi:hypothetical protein